MELKPLNLKNFSVFNVLLKDNEKNINLGGDLTITWDEVDEIVRKEIKQRIKEACNFYNTYKDNPKLLIEDYPHLLGVSPRTRELIEDLTHLVYKYKVNVNPLGRIILSKIGMRSDIKELEKEMTKKYDKLIELLKQELKVDFKDINEYNDWLFRISFDYEDD